MILTGFTHDADGDGDFDTTPRTSGNGPTSGFLEVDRDSSISISFVKSQDWFLIILWTPSPS